MNRKVKRVHRYLRTLPWQGPRRKCRVLGHDEALLRDEIMERLESELSSSEIITRLLELELSGRIKQLPVRNYVKSLCGWLAFSPGTRQSEL